jgi:hypothetical protein
MAKKNHKKTGKKGKGAKPLAETKLPEELRKPLALAVEFMQSPLARELAAAALVAIASTLVTRRDTPDGNAATKPREPARSGPDVANLVAQGITALISGLNQPAKRPDKNPETPESDTARPKPKLVP